VGNHREAWKMENAVEYRMRGNLYVRSAWLRTARIDAASSDQCDVLNNK
jgi:hypothetical protein